VGGCKQATVSGGVAQGVVVGYAMLWSCGEVAIRRAGGRGVQLPGRLHTAKRTAYHLLQRRQTSGNARNRRTSKGRHSKRIGTSTQDYCTSIKTHNATSDQYDFKRTRRSG
jgi:hypothetical protein